MGCVWGGGEQGKRWRRWHYIVVRWMQRILNVYFEGRALRIEIMGDFDMI